jgi:hypothetical protein
MSKQPREYRKLPGRGVRGVLSPVWIGSLSTLWQAKDHLLVRDTMLFQEDYKRYYFRDIQAVIIRATSRAMVLNIFLALFLSAMAAMWALSDTVGETVAGIFGIPALIFLTVNSLRGPSCVTYLQTAVHVEEVPSLNRLRRARRVLADLRRLIETEQGVVDVRELIGQTPPVLTESWPAQKAKKLVKHDNGVAHLWLFGVSLLDGVWSALHLVVQHPSLLLLATITSLALAGLVVFALVRQQGTDIPGALRGLVFVALCYVLLSFAVGYGLFFYFAFEDPMAATNQWSLMTKMAALSPDEQPWLKWLLVFSMVTAFSFGAPGMILTQRFRHGSTHQPPPTT